MATKLKTAALAVPVPQSKTDCASFIKSLGDVQRDFERTRAEMNDAIAAITKQYQPALEAITARADTLTTGIQIWCEANRVSICENGGKTANLVTGEVSWRQRPPSVNVRGADTVMENLKRLDLGRFIRVKEEINKDAILNEPDAVRGLPGINIVTGVEDFSINPFQVDVDLQQG